MRRESFEKPTLRSTIDSFITKKIAMLFYARNRHPLESIKVSGHRERWNIAFSVFLPEGSIKENAHDSRISFNLRGKWVYGQMYRS